jgi:hypothetical protein
LGDQTTIDITGLLSPSGALCYIPFGSWITPLGLVPGIARKREIQDSRTPVVSRGKGVASAAAVFQNCGAAISVQMSSEEAKAQIRNRCQWVEAHMTGSPEDCRMPLVLRVLPYS